MGRLELAVKSSKEGLRRGPVDTHIEREGEHRVNPGEGARADGYGRSSRSIEACSLGAYQSALSE